MCPGFFSHWPSCAQLGQSFSLSSHTLVQMPQVAGHSLAMYAGVSVHWPCVSQIAHAVTLVSLHGRATPDGEDRDWQLPQLRGQLTRAWPGFFLHSPRAAQPGQSFILSLHLPSHTPQVTGQCMCMISGRSLHRPCAPHVLQLAWMSEHLGEQRPQLVGHLARMNSGEFLHSPSRRHPSHASSVSEHKIVHTPQVCGHLSLTTSELLPVHSPCLPQPAHEESLSLQ
mmetsp:Transcript_6865/g.17121  ORF Transcript_6865/g.17121 Transcript_6865/m.17121 type:complete len:226 (-) Transcript_6865:106-783(-)